MNFEERIFAISTNDEFESLALELYEYQLEFNPIYAQFVQSLGKPNPKSVDEIPFLPISFFKSHQIITAGNTSELLFKSSGTGGERSQHFVAKSSIYKRSFLETFEDYFGKISDCVILALLPSYLEQGESSLVYMVDELITQSKSNLSGFCLNEHTELIERIEKARESKKKIILFGVSYALLDLSEGGIDLNDVCVVETGGMKGRRKELTKEELHQQLIDGLNLSSIYSEYGMTELLSQAYCGSDRIFQTPKWMQIRIRDTHDPLSLIGHGKTGGINVIDLANCFSCPFIATQDLGKSSELGFEVLGRFDQSDIRGCNLLIQ